jgi:radical SAM/Cys-rich protein
MPDSLARALDIDQIAQTSPQKTTSLRLRRSPLSPPHEQLAQLDAAEAKDSDGQPADFEALIAKAGFTGLKPAKLEIFQVNVGKLCNMACRHCHVDAGPDRTDAMMSPETVADVIAAIERSGAHTVDITGGAPELHPQFRTLVQSAVDMGKHVIDRCNLTILLSRRFADLPEWLAERGVEIVASLPHYRRLNTDAQRGDGTYERSIKAIRRLNEVGYGKGDPKRVLTLMSNPAGAYLGGCQLTIECEWKAQLQANHGVSFDRLFQLNNMPISRFLEWLVDKNQLSSYMQKLVDAFNPAAIAGLMCRNTISVSWDGRIYDCDFNQMLDIEAEAVGDNGGGQPPGFVRDFDPARYQKRAIKTARHCFGCTAGSGSSCVGATA